MGISFQLKKTRARTRESESKDDEVCEYEKIPVEDFGRIMLREMGWDGKMDDGNVIPKSRKERLGLGADPGLDS